MDLVELSKKWAEVTASIDFGKINEALNNLAKYNAMFVERYNAFDKWWQTAGAKIVETIQKINTPGYSEEKKKELVKSYKKWGEYAWTTNSILKFNYFSSLPNSLEDADKRMEKYCTLDNVIDIKNKLIDKGVNVADLEEALFNFEKGKYKSCTLILFALIDHELILKGFKHPPKENQLEGDFKLGFSAICEYKKQNKKDYDKSFLFSNLYFLNLMEALMTLFKPTENFTNEPDIINRNYISHGMSNRAVTKIDCFKVWSALYSLVILLPVLEDIKV